MAGGPARRAPELRRGAFVGTRAATAIWVAVWAAMAVEVVVSGRSPQGVHDLIAGQVTGQPGWLATIDRHAASLVAHRGATVAFAYAALCVVVACALFLPPVATRVVLVLAAACATAVWVVGQNFGMIFPGGATDPNSGPLLVLLVLAYWPLRTTPTEDAAAARVASGSALSVGVR